MVYFLIIMLHTIVLHTMHTIMLHSGALDHWDAAAAVAGDMCTVLIAQKYPPACAHLHGALRVKLRKFLDCMRAIHAERYAQSDTYNRFYGLRPQTPEAKPRVLTGCNKFTYLAPPPVPPAPVKPCLLSLLQSPPTTSSCPSSSALPTPASIPTYTLKLAYPPSPTPAPPNTRPFQWYVAGTLCT
jgi:hypothetical protein